MKVKSLSDVQLLATPWTAAYQAPPSMGFSRQEYWSGLPLPSPPKQLIHIINIIVFFNYIFKLILVDGWDTLSLSRLNLLEKINTCLYTIVQV